LAEELADTFIYLIKIAAQTGIDLESEYLKKLEKNRRRFPRQVAP
jgi:NTP pyrophosphatase (non-canonical NTP hydrolase)